MMSTYLHVYRANWRVALASYSRFLLRWGWFVLVAVVLTTLCSAFLPDVLSPGTYQATLQVQVELPADGGAGLSTSTTFFSQILVSPDTLSLVLPKHRDLQLGDLQALVTATPVSATNVVLLNVSGGTPHDASGLALDVYQAFIQEVHNGHSQLVTKLNGILTNELNQDESDIANSTAQLQSLSATHQEDTPQYRQVSALYQDQQKRALAITSVLTTLSQLWGGNNDILTLSSTTPAITTIPGAGPTQSQRLALSPLIGLIMGLGGVLLAGRFSTSLLLRNKKREVVLPHIAAVIPVLPHLRERPLQVLSQTSSTCLPLLLRLRFQAREHERRLQIITVTSPAGREGKSTTATGLALAAAQNELRTLLVDAHVRRPALHTWFQLPGDPGMLNALESLAAGSMYPTPINGTFIPQLGLIPVGKSNRKVAANRSEGALHVDGLRSFIDLLCSQADLIIFDGPPLLGDTNATNLAMFSDIVLLVADAQSSQSTKAIEAESLLSELGAPYAIILNRARPESVE